MYPQPGAGINSRMECPGEYREYGSASANAPGFAPRRRLGRSLYAALAPCLILIFPTPGAPANEPARDACSSWVIERFLVDRLNVWQDRLNLDHWKISVIASHRRDLRPNTLGNVQWYPKESYALIQVLNASEYKMGCRDMLYDMEFTVVHELLHLELASLPRSDTSRRDEEVAVNRIAAALISLDRGR